MYLYMKMSKSLKIHPEIPPPFTLPSVEKSKDNEKEYENTKSEKIFINENDNKLPKILSPKENTILNLLKKLNKENNDKLKNMEKEIDFEGYEKI